MKARKKFVVIAYDISSNKRRSKVVKAITRYGGRVNLSVFECMLTESQFILLKAEIADIIDIKTDKVAYYTMCVDCFASIVYQPNKKQPINISSTTIV